MKYLLINYDLRIEIEWFQTSHTWALKCQFKTKALEVKKNIADAVKCAEQCDSNKACTHFTYKPGVKECNLQGGQIKEADSLEHPQWTCGFANVKGKTNKYLRMYFNIRY